MYGPAYRGRNFSFVPCRFSYFVTGTLAALLILQHPLIQVYSVKAHHLWAISNLRQMWPDMLVEVIKIYAEIFGNVFKANNAGLYHAALACCTALLMLPDRQRPLLIKLKQLTKFS